MLTENQLQNLAAGIRAEMNQACVDALAIRNDVAMTEWINSASTQDAWHPEMTGKLLFEAGLIWSNQLPERLHC